MYRIGDYSMRPIEEGDLRQILEWRNSDEVHSMMLTDHKITWEEHCRWFEKIQQEPVKCHFVFEYQGHPVGYIGYNDFDESARTCTPGMYLGDRKTAPADAGLYLSYMAGKYAFEELGVEKIILEIFSKNKRALSINNMTGQEGEHYCIKKSSKRETVVRTETTREEYLKNREASRHLFEDF
ncbi:MAG: UDP-4-amino-4,6-dideoxy-N-acetyl-beta-L-altrosamine N-acetyltransferase [Fretibacterium sp.]|nr:UDP-4-amino-4,6-dideoxy-N-acetyl-beta-L-altrosamine N-acetyltransferase [Fretibacterium sp.]